MGDDDISLAPAGVRYVHLLFDRHQLVLSNGAWTESFQPCDRTLGAMGNAARAEVLELFPGLATPAGAAASAAARPVLTRAEAAVLSAPE